MTIPLLERPWEQEEEVPDRPGGRKAVHELARTMWESLAGTEAYFRQRWSYPRKQGAVWEPW